MRRASKLGSIILAVCELIVGILLLIDPVSFTKTILSVLGVILIIMGVVCVVQYFRASPLRAAAGKGLVRGCMVAALGIFCVANSNWFLAAFPVLTVVYGVATLISGFVKLQWTVDMLRLKMKKWGLTAAGAVLTIACALVILGNPFRTTAILWMFAGAALIAQAIVDIVATILAKPEENEIIF